MESLSDTKWDVLISGTGLAQSLLALALSRSGKKVLHIDRDDIYGGPEAALSLQDAESWCSKVNQESNNPLYPFESASKLQREGTALRPSRAYNLSLSPQLIYTQARLIPILVSSQVYQTLEFQAVGNWWIVQERDTAEPNERAVDIKRVPSGREDVFADDSINLRSKRGLMKFLRHIVQKDETGEPASAGEDNQTFKEVITSNFHLPDVLHAPLLALSLSPGSADDTPAAFALDRISKHMRSIGVFGPGFGSLIVKWGGLAEVTQACCRALAVGGGVYVLGHHIKEIKPAEATETSSRLTVSLDNGENVETRWIVGAKSDLPDGVLQPEQTPLAKSARAIYIISSPLESLFRSTTEGSPSPAGVVVVFPPEMGITVGPTYLIIHSSDTGECPHGQCIIYASTSISPKSSADKVVSVHSTLDNAIQKLLRSTDQEGQPDILWSLHYTQRGLSPLQTVATEADEQTLKRTNLANVLAFPPTSLDLSFDDSVIDQVKAVWKEITAEETMDEADFMRFESRENISDD